METGFIVLGIVVIVITIAGFYILVRHNDHKSRLKDTYGMLNVVYDESGGNPQLVLALYDPVEVVADQKQVLFDVNIIRQDSRK